MNIIKRIFSFGRSYDEFELLETEGGQPGFSAAQEGRIRTPRER